MLCANAFIFQVKKNQTLLLGTLVLIKVSKKPSKSASNILHTFKDGLICYPVASKMNIFMIGAWKKVGFHTFNKKKRCCPEKKSQGWCNFMFSTILSLKKSQELNIMLQIVWGNISPYFGTFFVGKYRGHVAVIYK